MDRITKSLMNELLINWNMTSSGESKDFENFVNYSILSNEYNKTFSIDALETGNGHDTGIDGIAIILNGILLSDLSEAEDVLETHDSNLEVDFIFIQSKTSSNFTSTELGNFLFGVEDFFADEPKLPRNEHIDNFSRISNLIFDNAAKFKRNPNLKVYYVTTGIWSDDVNFMARVNTSVNSLKATNLFTKVNFYPLGAQEISQLYRKSKESISTTF